MLLDESVEPFELATVVGSDPRGSLDADVSDIGDDDVLHANDVLCDLDHVGTETSGTDEVNCLVVFIDIVHMGIGLDVLLVRVNFPFV